MNIPKIIHQIYETKPGAQVSRRVLEWCASVQRSNAGFSYRFWNSGKAINSFVRENFPEFYDKYRALPFDVMRWDILRLMILYVEGGVYIDADVEGYESIEPLIKGCACAFALEPQPHAENHSLRLPFLVGTYFIAAEPKHSFIMLLIEELFEHAFIRYSTHNPTQVMLSTGPVRITEIYLQSRANFDVQLIDSREVSPLSAKDVPEYLKGKYFESAERARMVHLYASSWAEPIENKEVLEYQEYLKRKKSGA
ncbi:MAG: hypothetical protein LBN27_07855 [Prevotellaceae bacterium]|jgi:mannosyltransferase OCH1-like enzyme|nr:hypothetical protein [Prevotellaceae bacterium]